MSASALPVRSVGRVVRRRRTGWPRVACIELRERQHDVQSQRRGASAHRRPARGSARATKDADSVELKLTVPDPERFATVNALGIDALDAQIRQIFFFFDTPIWTSIGTASWYEPAGSRAGETPTRWSS